MIVLGLSGPMGSGKDAVADALGPLGFRRIAMADGVKDALDSLGGPTREIYKRLDAAGWSVRRGWQILGTESREDAGYPSLWVGLLLTKISFLARQLPEAQRLTRFVVPDIRYPHEADVLLKVVRAWDGYYDTVEVVRPGLEPTGDASHSSEQCFDRIRVGYRLVNDSDLDVLGMRARHLGSDIIRAVEVIK